MGMVSRRVVYTNVLLKTMHIQTLFLVNISTLTIEPSMQFYVLMYLWLLAYVMRIISIFVKGDGFTSLMCCLSS